MLIHSRVISDQGNEELRAQINALRYELDSLKQERELSELRHEKELREIRNKAETDFRRAQVRLPFTQIFFCRVNRQRTEHEFQSAFAGIC